MPSTPKTDNALGFHLLRTIPLHIEVKSVSLSPDARHIALHCLSFPDAPAYTLNYPSSRRRDLNDLVHRHRSPFIYYTKIRIKDHPLSLGATAWGPLWIWTRLRV